MKHCNVTQNWVQQVFFQTPMQTTIGGACTDKRTNTGELGKLSSHGDAY